MTVRTRARSADAPDDTTGQPRAMQSALEVVRGSRSARRGRAASLFAAACAAVALASGAAPAAGADGCANAQYRTGPSADLPDCRAYEMVTPADKTGYGLQQTRTTGSSSYPSISGDQAHFAVVTPFANPISGNLAMFVSRRTLAGWTTRNITPDFCDPDPSGISGYMTPVAFARDFSAAILRAPRSNCDPDDHAGEDLYLRPVEGNEFHWLSHNNEPKTVDNGAGLIGASADLDHVVFATVEKLVLPLEASRTGRGLYDRTGGRAVPVAVDDSGQLLNNCGIQTMVGHDNTHGAVSGDGRVILFQITASATPGCTLADDDGGQIFARVDHENTVLVSPTLLDSPEARQAPTFLGATDDGSRIFFRTTERLTEDATAGGGLYVYDLSDVLSGASDEGELRFLTPSVDGSPAGVTGSNVIGFAEDGSRVYFLAGGVLAPGAPVGVSPPKLYTVDDQGDQVRYLGRWTNGSTIDTTTGGSVSPDGSKLAFIDVVGGVRQIKLYDADDESVICASCPAGGAPQLGEARLVGRTAGARPGRLGPMRNVTDDGRVFFNSLDQLVPSDANSTYDVYEYADGAHRLLSSGQSPYDSLLFGVSPNGRDVFFTTHDSLVRADFDNGDQDLYVARVGGGFPSAASDAAPCAGDACQGSSPSGPSGVAAMSAKFHGAGNAVQRKAVRVSLVRSRMAVRGRTAALRLRISEAGRVVVRGRGIVNIARRLGKAGRHRVQVRLSKAGRRALARRGRVIVRVIVRVRVGEGQVRQARGRIVFRARNGKSGGR